MIRRGLWTAGALIVVAAAVSLIALPGSTPWTSSSAAAVVAFESGLDAETKLYSTEAVSHWERALELDPDFVIAKLELAVSLRPSDPERAAALVRDVLAADAALLSPRERLMVERLRAFVEARPADAARLLDEYLQLHPDDPYAVEMQAAALFANGDHLAAERAYHRLLELSPNWVLAYNQLGYLAMAAGRFEEAEEHLTAYRFIAPDQANPHDSLGELYLILGRLDEAESSFLEALRIRSDFRDSYEHLVIVRCLRRDFIGAGRVADEAARSAQLGDEAVLRLRCMATAWRWMSEGNWSEVVEEAKRFPACFDHPSASGVAVLALHRGAVAVADFELAEELEARYAPDAFTVNSGASPELQHMRGVRLWAQGDAEQAAALLRRVDGRHDFGGATAAIFRLYNRLLLAEVERARGFDDEAAELLSSVRRINPRLASDFSGDHR